MEASSEVLVVAYAIGRPGALGEGREVCHNVVDLLLEGHFPGAEHGADDLIGRLDVNG